jgi:hypothetical protein
MSVLTDSELETEMEVIGNETTPGANTAARIATMIADLINSKVSVLNPRVYRVLVSQASTDDPTGILLENGLDEAPVFSRSDVGVYSITTGALFTSNKTFASPQYATIRIAANYTSVNVELNTTSAISIQTYINGVASDDVLDNFPIEILVYP